MLEYDLKNLGAKSNDVDNPIYEPSEIIIDNEAVTAMAKCNMNTTSNRHVARGIIIYIKVQN